MIILNKTPVHSAKTLQLKKIMELGGKPAADLILESERWMARETARLHQKLGNTDLWLVGYSELKEGHFFEPYREAFKAAYTNAPEQWKKVYVYQHFSMNRFSIDLNEFSKQNPALPLKEQLSALGLRHKNEIFSICLQ